MGHEPQARLPRTGGPPGCEGDGVVGLHDATHLAMDGDDATQSSQGGVSDVAGAAAGHVSDDGRPDDTAGRAHLVEGCTRHGRQRNSFIRRPFIGVQKSSKRLDRWPSPQSRAGLAVHEHPANVVAVSAVEPSISLQVERGPPADDTVIGQERAGDLEALGRGVICLDASAHHTAFGTLPRDPPQVARRLTVAQRCRYPSHVPSHARHPDRLARSPQSVSTAPAECHVPTGSRP